MNVDGVGGGGLSNLRPADALGTPPTPPSTVDLAVQTARTGSVVEQGAAMRTLDTATGDARLSEALVRGDAEAATPAAATPGEVCTVEVRFKPAVGPANHAFIVTTDADSTNYFRGGPQANNTGLNSSSSGGDEVPYDPQFGIYGPIVTEYGAYVDGTVDWTTEPTGQQTVDRIAGSCDAVEAEFTRYMDDIEAARINYMPLSANSNSTVRETLERAGYDDVSPVVWAPAWSAQLPVAR